MRIIKTYEEFSFEDGKSDVQVLEKPKGDREIIIHNPDHPANEKDEDPGSFIDNKGVVHIKNWKTY